ncbi:ATP-grasp fold amidoligase family protein [Carnobacterium pleistocenium]|uniref:ATP-grasp fold amidoligase family protein n=1 Tax=Carnobacterium pleistocenium TaxID=181073 RepID=UPI00068ACDB1|nr:ATP-grasp fold amidoligase family protein [Carnobacterium pleistocenium]
MKKESRNYLLKQFKRLDERKLLSKIPDSFIIKIHYYLRMGTKLNLENPKTLNEKLQWLKLYDRKPEYSKMADKYSVREFIKNTIGDEYLIPLLGVWENFEDIEFNSLPNKFVLKANHNSGGIIICRDKGELDVLKSAKLFNSWLSRNYYQSSREWQYKNIKPLIIAEKYMDDGNKKGLTDYKFFCFNGEPNFVYLSSGLENHSTAYMSFYDLDGSKLPFKRSDYSEFPVDPKLPQNFSKMIELASILSKATKSPFMRVDFYEIEGSIFFSELTFRPNAGMIPFEPKEYDEKLGELVKL